VDPTNDEEQLAAQARFVRALVRRFTSDPHLADDIAQETWLAVIRHQAGGGPLTRGWLSTVARNFVLQTQRAEHRRRQREAAVARLAPGTSHDGACDADLHRRVLAAVHGLAPVYREVVRRRFYEDQMPVAIAEAMNVPVETVRTRLRRALEQLARALQR
jgi:RNA polymerase sigma-70 factor (ECF subfamily)